LAKRLSVKQKDEILLSFTNGKTIDELAAQFSCTKLTISRNLKKDIGDKKYKEIISQIKSRNNSFINKKSDHNDQILKGNFSGNNCNSADKKNLNEGSQTNDFFQISPFIEISPLNEEIDDSFQKDLSSIPISDIFFPNMVYMIVHKNIELETKYLKEYPEWEFLSKDELNRKTIQIFDDLKNARRFCNKEQKVIKVPNTKVFKIVAPLLVSRGISRIIYGDKLLAL
tara:strand:+ start:1091 stop:1771 length:681 start_codon:yes stop_codon:yes gene_type:complete